MLYSFQGSFASYREKGRKILMKRTILLLAFMLSLLLTGCCLQHEWIPATCTQPQTCAKCGETQGDSLGHSWTDATCTQPQACTVCGETQGDALGHSVSDWSVVTEASCAKEGAEEGVCTVCGEKIDRAIPKPAHTPGEWVITKEATFSDSGERSQSCAVCGEVLETESYSLSAEEKEAWFKADCTAYSYDTIARDPSKYFGTHGKYTGKIIQVMEDGDTYQLRVNITKGKYNIYTDTIYVSYKKDIGESRLLEDDIVTIYGTNCSTVSYTSVLGAKITLPWVVASYIDRK